MSEPKRIIDATIEELKYELLQEIKQELANLVQKIKPKPQTVWLTRDEASERLGVTKQTLHNWNVSGKLKAHKQGGVVRYKLADVQSFYK
ncbi:helix-turn-helix domain-containing protein [Psychroflexus sp. YR1-1]|uniref:Helix-turn-helix domain-containing protein n=1 Tax=Psychroflexus aurantiacus TaxID=2709310 RepID=A0A6B3R3H7_9FLAO|nr:helix-turn-helix domain-containing protein [Psychroflexus aurantiacus]NEV94952.1 helix-turn-helix domain-containing protein [Psychroflexus aurantiacus]